MSTANKSGTSPRFAKATLFNSRQWSFELAANRVHRTGTARTPGYDRRIVDEGLGDELRRLGVENEEWGRRYEQERFENEGRKLAWQIHGVDELLAAKKNTTKSRRRS